MPTFNVQIDSPDLRRRSLRIPAPDAERALRRGARRALALQMGPVCEVMPADAFREIASGLEKRASAVEVSA